MKNKKLIYGAIAVVLLGLLAYAFVPGFGGVSDNLTGNFRFAFKSKTSAPVSTNLNYAIKNPKVKIVIPSAPVQSDVPGSVTMLPISTLLTPDQVKALYMFNLKAEGGEGDGYVRVEAMNFDIYPHDSDSQGELSVSDYELYENGKLIAWNSDRPSFDLSSNPLLIPAGILNRFEVKAYVQGGETDDTVTTELTADGLKTDSVISGLGIQVTLEKS